MPAGEGIPLSIDIVRKYYSQIGEQLSGTFVLKPLKNGWARIKNRTVLNNFRFHPGDGLTYCFYSMDVPASMKNIEYHCFVRFTTILIAALREEQIADPFQDPVARYYLRERARRSGSAYRRFSRAQATFGKGRRQVAGEALCGLFILQGGERS